VKSSLTSDDISGIQSIYGARLADSFDAAASNNTRSTASVISSYIDANKQVTLTNLDATSTADVDWYKITVPSGHSGTMLVQAQSSELSLLAPKLALYKSNGVLISSITGSYNSTVSLTRAITTGQVYYIKVEGADETVFGTGRYALQVNMGTAPLPDVNGPDTSTPATGLGGIGSPERGGQHDDGTLGDGYLVEMSTSSHGRAGSVSALALDERALRDALGGRTMQRISSEASHQARLGRVASVSTVPVSSSGLYAPVPTPAAQGLSTAEMECLDHLLARAWASVLPGDGFI
jgi:hypothetical protein